METKNVIISIMGTQNFSVGDDDSIELVTDGEYCYSDDETTLTYMESELTGLEGTKTSFKVNPMSIVMSREGTLNSSMVFEEGRKHFFLYETPYGSATMGVNTSRIMTRLGEHGGKMEIDYMVDFDHSVVGRNKFVIDIREQSSGNSAS